MPGGPHPPLSVAMTWKANFTNPPSRGGTGIIVQEAILMSLCVIAVAVRLYTRKFLAKNLGLDDILIVCALVPLAGFSAVLILAFTKYGWDKHIWDIPAEQLVAARKIMFVMEIVYLWATAFTRVSILLFYRRLGGSVSPAFKRTVYAAIVFVVVFCVAYNIVGFTQCRPLNAYWNMGNGFWQLANEGKWSCADEGIVVVTCAAISMIQDFLVCILPMALFWHLRITFKQKVALSGIFGVGFFLCICGVLRMVYIVEIYYHTYDMTWESYQIWIWSGIESHVAIIIASLPALNHFFGYVKAGTVASGLRYGGSKTSDSTGLSTRKGYGRTTSNTDSHIGHDVKSPEAYDRAIHVRHDIKLEEFMNDERYDVGGKPVNGNDPRWAGGTRFIDDEEAALTPTKEKRPATGTTFLDEDTSGSDSQNPSRRGSGSRKYSGFADSRRFY